MRKAFIALSVAVLVAVAIAPLSAEPSPSEPSATAVAVAPAADEGANQLTLSLADESVALAAGQSQDNEGRPTEATCTAICTTGPNKTVSCGGSCTAVDQNCGAGQQGYAQCTGGSKVYCNPCGSVTCTAHCQYGPDRVLTCANGCAIEQDQNCAAGIQGQTRCNGILKTAYCTACPSCLNFYCSAGPCTTDADCCGTVDGGGFCSVAGSCICP